MAGISIDNISPAGCVDYANRLIELCEVPFPRISSIQNINSNFLVALFESITGQSITDLLLNNDSITEIHNIQAVIDTLSLDVINISLSHLTAEDIVDGNILSILNLLEIFEAVFVCLYPRKERNLKDPSGISVEDASETVTSTYQVIPKPVSLKSVALSSDENIPPTRVLKRKTCRKTLQKPRQNHHIPEKKVPEASQTASARSSHSKRNSDTVDGLISPLKRKFSKPSRTMKRPHTESIEDLYGANFEKKVRALLSSDESPIQRAQQLKRDYIQSLKTPLKKAPIPPCKKSFLLPHNLRRKTKSSVRQSPTRKRNSQRQKNSKYSVSEPSAKHEKDADIPAIIQSVMEEFPGFKFPKNTLELLTKHYYQHVSQMHKQLRETLLKKPTKLIQTEKAMEDQAKLNKILIKDLKEKNHLREVKEHRIVENKIKCTFRNARLQSVRTRQYFVEYHESMSKKMKKRNFSEEVLIEKTFKDILDLQKEKVRLLCQNVKETDAEDAKQHRQYLDALKNLYQQQLSLLADSIKAEEEGSSTRAKTQKWAVEKMNQEFRKKLQKEVRSLQKNVLDMIKDIHFRELDAQNFIKTFQQQDS